jgi:hypothetical protein
MLLVATATAASAALGGVWGGVGICIFSPLRRKPPSLFLDVAIAGWRPPGRDRLLGTVKAWVGQHASAKTRTAVVLGIYLCVLNLTVYRRSLQDFNTSRRAALEKRQSAANGAQTVSARL